MLTIWHIDLIKCKVPVECLRLVAGGHVMRSRSWRCTSRGLRFPWWRRGRRTRWSAVRRWGGSVRSGTWRRAGGPLGCGAADRQGWRYATWSSRSSSGCGRPGSECARSRLRPSRRSCAPISTSSPSCTNLTRHHHHITHRSVPSTKPADCNAHCCHMAVY